jgi:tRNA A37 threonylcarbamoyladenosine dehydratase
VAVLGLGGVGSWTVEALARTGVGRLTLVDLDDVCITNVNRQLPALDGEIGRAKAVVLAERVARIDPACEVEPVTAFLTRTNGDRLLHDGLDVIVDCIDAAALKALVAARARAIGVASITVGGAAGRRDPTQVRIGDLGLVEGDPLLRRVRRELRRTHGFARASNDRPVRMDVTCVWSPEPPLHPWSDGTCRTDREPGAPLALDCTSGFGTAAFTTGAFGLAAAAEAVRVLTSAEDGVERRRDLGGELVEG